MAARAPSSLPRTAWQPRATSTTSPSWGDDPIAVASKRDEVTRALEARGATCPLARRRLGRIRLHGTRDQWRPWDREGEAC
eukprot:1588633-Pyramimonas_sp.AAC.1